MTKNNMDIPNMLYNPNGIIRESLGGDLSTPLDWNELTMKEKAAYIRMGVANGYKDIDSIKEVYNEFKCGGNLYKEGGPKKQEYIYDVLPRLLKEAGLNIRVTSGYRKPGAVGTAGNRSWHPRHGAVDIVPMGKTTFEDIEEVLHTNPTIVKYMLDNGFGLLDESGRSLASRDTMKRTGATGAHFHIGRDSKPAALYKQRVVLYSPMATTDNRKVYFSNPHLPIPEDLPQPRQAVSIQTPAKPLLNTTLDSNILTNLSVMQLEEPVVDKLIHEVVVTALAPRRYAMPNPQELLDLMNSMMVPYELPEVPKPITATERLAWLNEDRNTLLLLDLENSILRASRLGTPLDEVKLARDVKDLQFYRNMAANGGNLFLTGGPQVDAANAHIYDGTTEDSQQINNGYIYTARPSQYDFQVTTEAPTVYWDGFNWIGFNDLGLRVIKGSEFNPNGANIIEDPLKFELARLALAAKKDINRTHEFGEMMRNVATGLTVAPAITTFASLTPMAGEAIANSSIGNSAMLLMSRPVSTITKGIAEYIPQASKILPYMESIDRGIWGTSGLLGMKDAYEGYESGDKHWANALAEGALEGMMMTELSPAVKNGYSIILSKLNAPKPQWLEFNKDAMYRIIGEEGYQDAINTGILRPNMNPNSKYYRGLNKSWNWFTKGYPNDGNHLVTFANGKHPIDSRYPGDVIVEVSPEHPLFDAFVPHLLDADIYKTHTFFDVNSPYIKFYKRGKKGKYFGIDNPLYMEESTKSPSYQELFSSPERTGVSSKVITDPNDANFVLKMPKKGLTLELVQLAIELNQTLGKYPFILPLEHVETITGDDGLFYPIWRQLKITPYGREAIFGPDGKLLQGEALEALRTKSNEIVEAIRQLAQQQGLQLLDGRILTPDGLIQDFGEFHNVGITSDGRPVIFDALLALKPRKLKDYAKYFSAALGTLPIINKSILNGK